MRSFKSNENIHKKFISWEILILIVQIMIFRIYLEYIVELHDLHQLIKTPTRVTAHTETIVDHLYASNGDFVYDVSVPLPLLLVIIILSALHVLSLENNLNVKHIKLFNTAVMLYLMKNVFIKTYLERWRSLILHTEAKLLISTLRMGPRPSANFQ